MLQNQQQQKKADGNPESPHLLHFLKQYRSNSFELHSSYRYKHIHTKQWRSIMLRILIPFVREKRPPSSWISCFCMGVYATTIFYCQREKALQSCNNGYHPAKPTYLAIFLVWLLLLQADVEVD